MGTSEIYWVFIFLMGFKACFMGLKGLLGLESLKFSRHIARDIENLEIPRAHRTINGNFRILKWRYCTI